MPDYFADWGQCAHGIGFMFSCTECSRLRLDGDEVNHPTHYTSGPVECIDAMESALTPEEFRGYCKGNAMKYLWRCNLKGGEQDLEKAKFYLNRLTRGKS